MEREREITTFEARSNGSSSLIEKLLGKALSLGTFTAEMGSNTSFGVRTSGLKE